MRERKIVNNKRIRLFVISAMIQHAFVLFFHPFDLLEHNGLCRFSSRDGSSRIPLLVSLFLVQFFIHVRRQTTT